MADIEDIATNFGLHLRGLRLDASLSQEALAQRAGVHPTYISQVERGRRNPTLTTLARLAAALEVSLGELVGFSRQGE